MSRVYLLAVWAFGVAACGPGADPRGEVGVADKPYVLDLIVPQPPPPPPPPPRDVARAEVPVAIDDPFDAALDEMDVTAMMDATVDLAAEDAFELLEDVVAPNPDLLPSFCDAPAPVRALVPPTVGPPCAPGETLCEDGCFDLSSSGIACGACGRNCTSGAHCESGACVCNPGYTRCGAECFILRISDSNCGACGNRCSPSLPYCDDGVCGCTPGRPDVCAGQCTSLQFDPRNCGACGHVCPAAPNALPSCNLGVCGLACRGYYGDCDGVEANGCEVNTESSLAHCGACGRRCAAPSTTSECLSRVCRILGCAAGFSDCNADPTDGCEADLATSAFHCGACSRACLPGARCVAGACVCPAGVVSCAAPPMRAPCIDPSTCPERPAAGRACVSGTCGIVCARSAGNCDGDDANGCESWLSSQAHCGRCGNACATGQSCIEGQCRCPPGASLCAARCAHLSSDREHCGACGRACAAGEACVGGSCVSGEGARPLAPLAAMRVTSRRPTLRWRLGRGRTGARVTLCADRPCARVLSSQVIAGIRWAPEADLPPGVVFWRVEGRREDGGFDPPSATWAFVVGPRSAPADNAFGRFDDFNGDGRADFVQPRLPNSGAYATLHPYHGATAGLVEAPATRLRRPEGGFRFPPDVKLATSDFDGDGYTDLVLLDDGFYQVSNGLRVFRGGPDGIGVTAPVHAPLPPVGSWVRMRITPLGDVDGDGYADLAIFRNYGDSTSLDGRNVVVLAGGPSGLMERVLTEIDAPLESLSSYGHIVAAVGDINRDGYDDFAVTAPRAARLRGLIHFFFGADQGPSALPDLILPNPEPSRYWFGVNIGAPGDLDGDGLPEIFVTGGGEYEPDCWLFRGGVGSPHSPVRLRRIVDTSLHWARGVGDFNGDGYGDLVQHSAQGCFVTYGMRRGEAPRPPQEVVAPSDARYGFGRTVDLPGDVNGDGFDDMLIGAADYVYLYLGSACGIAPRPARSLETWP